jgi:leucine-rich repeat protein SHOC2
MNMKFVYEKWIKILTGMILLMALTASDVQAQSDACKSFLEGGDSKLEEGDLAGALEAYLNVLDYDCGINMRPYFEALTDRIFALWVDENVAKVKLEESNRKLVIALHGSDSLLHSTDSLYQITLDLADELRRTNIELCTTIKNITTILDNLYFFRDKLAVSMDHDKFGYMNKQGVWMIEPFFDKAEVFFEPGFAEVEADGESYLTDMEGKLSRLVDHVKKNKQEVQFAQAIVLKNAESKKIPKVLYHLPSLVVLDLQYSGFSRLRPDISNLSNLNSLRLDNAARHLDRNQVRRVEPPQKRHRSNVLPPEIGKLRRLRLLELFDNDFTEISAEIGGLDSLQFLKIVGNLFTSIPREIGGMAQLQELSLAHNRLKKLPQEIGRLSLLTKLDLSHNHLKSVPDSIGRLFLLRHLDLSANAIDSLPKTIGGLMSLQSLRLNDNSLATLPPKFFKLKALEQLDLTRNQLSTLPNELGKLTQLRKLSAGKNMLEAIPVEIGNLTRLEKLTLSNNKIRQIPESIGKLLALQELNLDHDSLDSVPKEICQLIHLESLDLAYNQLHQLPNQFWQLKSLGYLNLAHNHLTSLPPITAENTLLTEVNLSGNDFKDFPEKILDLPALSILHMGSNPCSDTDVEREMIENKLKALRPKCKVIFD